MLSRAPSTSIEEMFSPPLMITSLYRSRISTYPSGCMTAASPSGTSRRAGPWPRPRDRSSSLSSRRCRAPRSRQGATVTWHVAILLVDDPQLAGSDELDALARLRRRARGRSELCVFRACLAYGDERRGFGEPLDVGDLPSRARLRRARSWRRGWRAAVSTRRPRGIRRSRSAGPLAMPIRTVGAAQQRADPLALDVVIDRGWIDLRRQTCVAPRP